MHSRAVSKETFTQQARTGAAVFRAQCASCHGSEGQGTERAPRVVGEGALQHRTAADVARVLERHAPRVDTWSVLAFELKANGIDLGNVSLDAEVAERTDLPRRGVFR